MLKGTRLKDEDPDKYEHILEFYRIHLGLDQEGKEVKSLSPDSKTKIHTKSSCTLQSPRPRTSQPDTPSRGLSSDAERRRSPPRKAPTKRHPWVSWAKFTEGLLELRQQKTMSKILRKFLQKLELRGRKLKPISHIRNNSGRRKPPKSMERFESVSKNDGFQDSSQKAFYSTMASTPSKIQEREIDSIGDQKGISFKDMRNDHPMDSDTLKETPLKSKEIENKKTTNDRQLSTERISTSKKLLTESMDMTYSSLNKKNLHRKTKTALINGKGNS